MRFAHFSGKDFAPGDILTIHLSDLPKAGNQRTFTWVALGLIVPASVLVFVYMQRRMKLKPVSHQDSLARRKQRLIVELAELDDNFEGGTIPEEDYHKLRAEKKAQLVELMSTQENSDR